jgi:serine/threonine-protein kinase
MIEAPIPDDEERRLALLRACNIIYTPQEAAFDDIARLAAEICGTEIALITLVDSDYQWFKARVGIEQVGTPRDLSFCSHCINHKDALVVEDTHEDPRFADNPLVTGEPRLRFYAGVPLLIDEGSSIGALSVADRAPRTITPRQLDSLERLARQVARELRLRRDLESKRAGNLVSPPSTDLPVGPGSTIAKTWRIVRELGRGAAGGVFQVEGPNGERAAIKLLYREWTKHDQVVERFAREARVLMRLDTPRVAKLLEVGNLDAKDGALPYLVLEYLEGVDLDRVLREDGRIAFRPAVEWCADACEGVAAAHALGVIHRDLKPSNVFLANRAGMTPTVKVLDFGIASSDGAPAGSPKISKLGTVMGTPFYMAPEQMMSSSDVDARSDVWSMGATLYELVSGETPFRGESDLEIFANVLTKPPIPLRAHFDNPPPTALETVIQSCLRRNRDDRFPTMTELARALRAAIA